MDLKRQSTCEGPHVPMRACAACRQRQEAAKLLRFVRSGGRVSPDLARRSPGRGLNLCPTLQCLKIAVQRHAFSRKLGSGINPDLRELRNDTVEAFKHALGRLIRDGERSGFIDKTEGRADLCGGPADWALNSSPTVPNGLHQRFTWLLSGFSEFTFHQAGDMTRPSLLGTEEFESPQGLSETFGRK